MTLPVDYNMVQRWGITLDELDKVAMENSIRDYPPILKASKDSGRGKYNLLFGDTPNKIDKYYVIINLDCYHSVNTLAYLGVLEKIAEILDDDFYFYAKNSIYSTITPCNENYDGLLLKTPVNWNPMTCKECAFSPYVHKYDRKSKKSETVYYVNK